MYQAATNGAVNTGLHFDLSLVLIPVGSGFDCFLGYLNTLSKFEVNNAHDIYCDNIRVRKPVVAYLKDRPLSRHMLGGKEN
jgi:hypothetical protein